MNRLVLLLTAILSATAVCNAEETYTDRFDNLNVEEIMSNKRLLNAYVNCVLDKGKCTAEGKEMKAHIQDAMQSGCAKCTKVQRQKARQVVNYIKENEKNFWEQLKAKYDPGDKYKDTYEAFLAQSD